MFEGGKRNATTNMSRNRNSATMEHGKEGSRQGHCGAKLGTQTRNN